MVSDAAHLFLESRSGISQGDEGKLFFRLSITSAQNKKQTQSELHFKCINSGGKQNNDPVYEGFITQTCGKPLE